MAVLVLNNGQISRTTFTKIEVYIERAKIA